MIDEMKYCRDCYDRMDCELYVNYLKYEACHNFRGANSKTTLIVNPEFQEKL